MRPKGIFSSGLSSADGRRALVAIGSTIGLAIGLAVGPAEGQGNPLPPGKNVELVTARCIICHSLEMVAQQRQDLAGWQETVDRMVSYGAPISHDEKQAILSYLVTFLGP